MQTSYIYSVSRVNILTQFLLNKTDIERLLVADAGADLQSALKETYLAPYVLRAKSDDIAEAIELTLVDAKKLVHKIAPNGDMFRVLWVQYDIHNLRVFAKARARQLSFEECERYVSRRGIYEPQVLHTAMSEGRLSGLQAGWQEAFNAAAALVDEGALDRVDGVFDALLFDTIKRIATTSGDAFIATYTAGLIDMFNIKSRLRTLNYPDAPFTTTFVSGGTYPERALATRDDVFSTLSRFGSADTWKTAVEVYETTGNSTQLDARAEEYLIGLAKQASTDMFSSASLVLYYLRCRQSAANIRTIVVGKNSGMSLEDIRANLRFAYVYE